MTSSATYFNLFAEKPRSFHLQFDLANGFRHWLVRTSRSLVNEPAGGVNQSCIKFRIIAIKNKSLHRSC